MSPILLPLIKSMHVIFIVAWMAGLLMYPRLKIYQMQSQPGDKQFETMQNAADRLRRIIMTPSLIVVWLMGIALLWITNWAYLYQGWFHVKLLLVIVATAFHGIFVSYGKKIDAGASPVSERRLRMMNEVPFVMLIGAVILAFVKPF